MLFGRDKSQDGKTVLILDIENGSVGAALLRFSQDKAPEFLGSWREHLPVRATRDAESLADSTQKIIKDLMPAISLEATLLRQGFEGHKGGVSTIAAFLSPPWGKPNLETGKPDFVPHLQDVQEWVNNTQKRKDERTKVFSFITSNGDAPGPSCDVSL